MTNCIIPASKINREVLDAAEVAALLQVSVTTAIGRLTKAGVSPLHPRTPRLWLRSDVMKYLETQHTPKALYS